MVAAWFVCVPIRIHTFTGQVWVTRKGIMKLLLKLMDRITATLATLVIVDSSSQRDFLIDNRIVSEGKSHVLGDGSISGVDVDRFSHNASVRKMLRECLDVANSTIIFLFIGRLKRDKGVFELALAFASISKEIDDLALWYVGPDEDNIQDDIKSITLNCNSSILFAPYTERPEDYMTTADINCLPSYREGFGTTIIEAAACGLPSIGSKIYGITDAIVDGETGVLVEKGDVDALAFAMFTLAKDPSLRKNMGKSAKKRALEKFHQQRVSDSLMTLMKEQSDLV
jgi:glycosyltransferase involved in cell wall biosynthesis